MSRFMSAGADDDVAQDDEWLRAQQAIEATRQRKQKEETNQNEGKSLYEILQENKVAKQEAFEESIKLKNQFRSLDDDEVDFLDSVLDSTRAKDAAIKRETAEQLEVFRKEQEKAEKAALAEEKNDPTIGITERWFVSGKRRKKTQEKETGSAVKLRKLSSANGARPGVVPNMVEPGESHLKRQNEEDKKARGQKEQHTSSTSALSPPSGAPLPRLGLEAYSSDED